MKKIVLMLIAVSMVFITACSSSTDRNSTLSEKSRSEKKSGNEKKTIVFSTAFSDEFFKVAKQRYEAKHPHITIELTDVETSDAEMETALEKHVKTTGTAMMSGKGPDLLELDQLPAGDYVKKQLLANIGDMIEQDPTFKKEHYFGNILDGMKSNGGIFGLPLGFFVYGLVGNEMIINNSGVKIDDTNWTWGKFASISKEISNKSGKTVLYSLPEEMTRQLVNDQFASFVDQQNRKVNFDSDQFIQLLIDVKSMFDEKVIVRIDEPATEPIFTEVNITSPEYYMRELKQSVDNKLYSRPTSNGQSPGGFFRTYKTLGINANSDVKEEAWDFVKFMMSEEMQDQIKGAGFPLNKSSYDKVVKDVLAKGKVESDQPIGPLKGKVYEITKREMEDLEKYIFAAKYPVQYNPSKIDNIILEESKAYFAGQKSPEAVAKLIHNKVTTIINE
ncbi:ABC transporter substrate-binding protein [Paenibacillus aquistagni]|uniref:ABC transporter substrate-binding protein n=1 Tax=Paenibacillus aquistagni TaxID=1852522 RepID=UPI000B50AFF6|nr:extracellular solute-binding protein [Paenibacillus aquistagni]